VGAWSSSLYGDDTALDLRREWQTGIRWGRSAEELTNELLDQFGDDETVVWLVLADLQWRSGLLLSHVRERALQIISRGADLERWREASPEDQAARRVALEELSATLVREPPPPRVLRRPPGADTPMKIGEIYSWRLLEGRYAFFQVVGLATNVGAGRAPALRVLDLVDGAEHPIAELAGVPSRKTVRYFPRMVAAEPTFLEHPLTALGVFGPHQFPKARLRRLGVAPPPLSPDDTRKTLAGSWLSMDKILATVYGVGWWIGEILAWRRQKGPAVLFSVCSIGNVRAGNAIEPLMGLELLRRSNTRSPTSTELSQLAAPLPRRPRGTLFSMSGFPPHGRFRRRGRVAREPLDVPFEPIQWNHLDRELEYYARPSP
jgi:hypothetical protein